jgi:rhomboid protease GluP
MNETAQAPPPLKFSVAFVRGTNNLGLVGPGDVTVGENAVFLADKLRILGFAVKDRFQAIPLADLVDCEQRDRVVILRTRHAAKFADLQLRSHEDAASLLALLPTETTEEFRAQLAHEQQFHERLDQVSARAPVTPTLIALNIAVFLVMVYAGAGFLETDATVHLRFGSNYGPFTWSGEPWRLITSAFIHFGVMHLAFNMYALWSGGILTERLFGSARFALIYLLSALSGSVASGWWDPLRNSAGASGAIFGVYGALLVFFALRRADIPRDMLRTSGRGALTLCAYSLVLGATNPLIDNACHVGGLLGGAVAAYFLVRPVDPALRAQRQPLRLATVAAGICAALFALAAPLALPGSARNAALRLAAVEERFSGEESRLVDLEVQIIRDHEAKRLGATEAASRMERDVLVPWRQAMQAVLRMPAIEPADSAAARRLALMQNYVRARERATALTIHHFRDPGEATEATAARAWDEVGGLINQIKALPGPPPT